MRLKKRDEIKCEFNKSKMERVKNLLKYYSYILNELYIYIHSQEGKT